MKFFHKHAFSPIKGEQNIQPTCLFRTTPLFGPLEYISKKIWIILYSDLVPFFSNTKYVCISRFGSKKSLSFNGSFAGKASACRQQVYLWTMGLNSFWRSFYILMQLHFHNIFLTSILYVNDRIFHKHLVRMKMHGFFFVSL